MFYLCFAFHWIHLKRSELSCLVDIIHCSVPQIERVADVACLLVDGSVVEVATPAELTASWNPLVAKFFTGEMD